MLTRESSADRRWASGFDQALTKYWDWNNKGVSRWLSFVCSEEMADNLNQRQWKDIRHKYVESEEE